MASEEKQTGKSGDVGTDGLSGGPAPDPQQSGQADYGGREAGGQAEQGGGGGGADELKRDQVEHQDRGQGSIGQD